jgi:aryl-alcohol dehydrogenase-like predicted oxidoreductase
VIRGCWQLSEGHGQPWDRGEAFRVLDRAAARARAQAPDLERPFALDMGDIYTGVEERVGSWLAARSESARGTRIHTKLVPDLADLPRVGRSYVTRVVERSLRRLGLDAVDLVQLHWWDFGVAGWIDAAGWLDELRVAGKIRLVGVTNFDPARLEELMRAGVEVASHQAQYSLLDRRPAEHAWPMPLLAYGALAGGLLSERWVGQAPPGDEPENRSLVKYLLIVEEVGGWSRLQELLGALERVALRRGVSIPDVATRWVLERPGVAAVIAGTSGRSHTLDPFAFELASEDLEEIARALPPPPPGEPYELERQPGGRHAAIMRYDLNQQE